MRPSYSVLSLSFVDVPGDTEIGLIPFDKFPYRRAADMLDTADHVCREEAGQAFRLRQEDSRPGWVVSGEFDGFTEHTGQFFFKALH